MQKHELTNEAQSWALTVFRNTRDGLIFKFNIDPATAEAWGRVAAHEYIHSRRMGQTDVKPASLYNGRMLRFWATQAYKGMPVVRCRRFRTLRGTFRAGVNINTAAAE